MKLPWFAVCFCVAAGAASAAEIPSGNYGCQSGTGSRFGFLQIKGATYRGITYDPAGPYAPYTMATGDKINFTAGLGDFNAAGAKTLGATYRGTSGSAGRRPWVSIDYTTPGGNQESLDCSLE